MSTRTTCQLLSLLLLLATPTAEAAISCSISSPGFSANYSGALTITQTALTINCNRLSTDPANSAYSVRPTNGAHNAGQQNRAALSTYFLNYEEYQDSTCATLWKPSGGATISGTIRFGASLTASAVKNFWGCVPASQTYAAGLYTDTVTMTLTYNNGTSNVNVTGTHAANITTPNACSINTSPTSLAFTYTARQAAAVVRNTTFKTICTILGTYSMSITPVGGVVSGLNYALLLSTASTGGSMPLGSTGTGAQQTFYINGTMPANQAGACATASCNGTQTHTLTVSF